MRGYRTKDHKKLRGRYRPITPEEIDGYIALRGAGATMIEIGIHFDRHPETVRLELKKLGLSDRQVRPIRIEGDIAYVPLTKGKFAIVDAADVHVVEGRNWYAACGQSDVIYARTEGRGFTGMMHVLLMKPPAGKIVDHRDHDGLNNRRNNLRITDKRGNSMNARRGRGGELPRGITRDRRDAKFTWNISRTGYATAEEASLARLEALKLLYGEDYIEPTEKLTETA